MKKLFAVLLAVVMVLSLGVTAFAAGKITVANAPDGKNYAAYKIFDATVDDNDKVVYTLAADSPWVAVLVDESSDYNSKVDNLEFMKNSAGDYVVISQTGFSAADFATLLCGALDNGEVTDTPVISQADPATAALNNQDNTQVIQNLEDGYYLVRQIDEVAVETSDVMTGTNFTYKGTEDGAKNSDITTPDLYDQTVKYYQNAAGDVIPESYYNTLDAAAKADYELYYKRLAEIDESTFQALVGDGNGDEIADYAPNAKTFSFKSGATPVSDLSQKDYDLLPGEQQALYEKDQDVWYHNDDTDGANPISDADYQAYDASFQTNFTAGQTYKTKDIITAAAFKALNTDDSRALMANYEGVDSATSSQVVPAAGATVTPVPDATPALTTVLDGQNVQVQQKDDMPLEKTVEDAEGNDINNQGVSVGDELTYTITSKVPVRDDAAGETIFRLWDKMSKGLTLKDNKIIITIGEGDDAIEYELQYIPATGDTYETRAQLVQKKNGEATTDFTLIYDPNRPLTGYEVRFEPESKDGYTFELSLPVNLEPLRSLAGQPITVVYVGIVNDEAIAELLVNAASLYFKDDNGEWIKDVETDNYISRIVIDKFETGNRTQKLAGAEFVLYKETSEDEAKQAAYDAVVNTAKQAAYDRVYAAKRPEYLDAAKGSESPQITEDGKTYADVKAEAEAAVIEAGRLAYAALIGVAETDVPNNPTDANYRYWHTDALVAEAEAAGTAAADAAAAAYADAKADEDATAAANDAVTAEVIAAANAAKAAASGGKLYYQLSGKAPGADTAAIIKYARFTDESGTQYDKPLVVDENGALVLDEDGNVQTYSDVSVAWVDLANATTVRTDANGFAQFAYLPDGTYSIEETKAPIDYAKLLNPIEIVVDGSDATDTKLNASQREDALTNIAYVENTPGTSLPSTGGVGATMMTIGGIALIVAAGAFLVLRRRKEQE